jgi:sulfur-oxidizing protein SoxY
MSSQDTSPTRRLVLMAAAGFGLTPFAPPAAATPAAMEEAIGALVGAAPVKPGKVKLELPPIVENGNTVPLTVTVDSPMSQTDHVTGIHIGEVS